MLSLIIIDTRSRRSRAFAVRLDLDGENLRVGRLRHEHVRVVVGPGPSRHTTYLLQARGVLSARTLLDVQLLQHHLTAECVQDLVEILRNIGYRFRAAKQQSRDI